MMKAISYLTAIMFIFMLILLTVKMKPIFSYSPDENIIAYNDVLGSAIIRKQTPYTLNFDQQNSLIYFLNKLSTDDISEVSKKLDFEQIIIYRFQKPNLVIEPIGLDNKNNLLLKIIEDDQEHLMKDNSFGKMKLCLNSL